MNNTRLCLVKRHEMNRVMSIRAHKDCEQTNRWFCSDCKTESLHSHGGPN